LETEEDFGIDGRATAAGVAVGGKIAHESEIEDAVEVTIEMILRHRRLEGDEDGTIEVTVLGRAEHGASPFRTD
jgi:hypothetical protein